jgi:hypothetical protein
VLVTVFRVDLVFPEDSAVGINHARVVIFYQRDNVGSFVGSTASEVHQFVPVAEGDLALVHLCLADFPDRSGRA